MKKPRVSGNFFVCLLFNMIFNFEWSIPAWILLACHFIFDISIWWFWSALGLWILILLSWMWTIGWASRVGSEPTPYRENKNPYSVKNKDFLEKNNKNDK